ncbi:MAG: hypothetical protein ABFD62_14085 [Syntrophaceae bacterium]
MAEKKNAREELLKFLDSKAFDPVLKASADRYHSDAARKKLEDARQATESTKKRYHEEYGSAGEVVKRFKDDLSSEAARRVQSELKELGLPTLPELSHEFEQLADRMGVR